MSPRSLDLAAIVVDIDVPAGAEVYLATPEWDALLDWCRFHHLDPTRIPAGSRICRVASARLIAYTEFDLDDQGLVRHHSDGLPVLLDRKEQGEAPPLPFPDSILALLRPSRPSTPETT